MAGDLGFWERLTSLPAFAGKSQHEIGRVVGVWQTAVNKWALGRGLPTLPKAIILATKGGVCVDWLLTGRPPKFPGTEADPTLAPLAELWQYLTPDTRAEVIGFAAYKRTVQTTADPARVAEFHAELTKANHQFQSAEQPKK